MNERLVVGVLERLADDRVAAAVAVVDHAGEVGIGRLARGWPDDRARGTARTGAGSGRACRRGSRTSPSSNDSSSWSIIASRSRQAIVALVEKRLFARSARCSARHDLRPCRSCDRGRSRRARSPAIFGGLADREERALGIEVDRRGVERKLRLEADEMEPHHPADRLEHPELELDPQPVAPAALADRPAPWACRRTGARTRGPRGSTRSGDLDAQVVARLGIAGADQVGGERRRPPPGWSRTTFSLSRGLAASSVV